MPVEIIEAGSILKLPRILKENNLSKLFLVAGKNSYILTGMDDFAKKYLHEFHLTRFSAFNPNPCLEDIKKGSRLFLQDSYDAVIAIGGGTAIDVAKLIKFTGENNLSTDTLLSDQSGIVSVSKVKLLAIPTTAGSGAEATSFAVMYSGESKYSVAHESLLPDFSIIDPDLARSMPAKLAASCGFDALSQAIEAFWSVNSTEESDLYAQTTISILFKSLVDSVKAPTAALRLNMAKAANLAGKAINITKTTAAHAFSYPLTSHYNISHGHAVAIMMLFILEINFNCRNEDVIDARGTGYFKYKLQRLLSIAKCCSESDFISKWKEMMTCVGLSYKFTGLGIKSAKDIGYIVNNVNSDRLKNHPIKIDKMKLLKSMLQQTM